MLNMDVTYRAYNLMHIHGKTISKFNCIPRGHHLQMSIHQSRKMFARLAETVILTTKSELNSSNENGKMIHQIHHPINL